jgi:hypothetical protein
MSTHHQTNKHSKQTQPAGPRQPGSHSKQQGDNQAANPDARRGDEHVKQQGDNDPNSAENQRGEPASKQLTGKAQQKAGSHGQRKDSTSDHADDDNGVKRRTLGL